jgi:repressor LexA
VDGDYVLVEKSETARDGEIVVALVDGTDATLKRFYREGANVRLQPSNAAMKPIMVPAKSVQLQGRVIGVLRKY